jgi:DNA-binding response OmpR family regulator
MLLAHERTAGYRPCLVLADPDPAYAAAIMRSFRRLGWDVYEAKLGPEARRLARMLDADLVILAADLPEETGWLTCAKLVRERPHTRIILVDHAADPRARHMAAFVGAKALVRRDAGMEALLPQIHHPMLLAAG